MAATVRAETNDGYESHVQVRIALLRKMRSCPPQDLSIIQLHRACPTQTNFFGPILLTRRLMPLLLQSNAARVVNVASKLHCVGELKLGDFNMKHKWSAVKAYAFSKLLEVRALSKQSVENK